MTTSSTPGSQGALTPVYFIQQQPRTNESSLVQLQSARKESAVAQSKRPLRDLATFILVD